MYDLANLENLDGAQLVRVYTSVEGFERVYAWFGGQMVVIYNANLEEIDVFNFNKLETQNKVNEAIEIHEDTLFNDERHTEDIFYSHGLDTGEDLEVQ